MTWSLVDCGAYLPGDIYMHVVPGNAWWQGMTFNNARQSITNVSINGNRLYFSGDNQ